MLTKKANRAAETVYLQIKADIFDFRLLPGDRFTETELAERYGLSRTPVRDALYRLRHEGYVEVEFRSGWHIRPFDFVRFDELYDLRIIIECAAVERICQSDEPAVLKELRETWLVPAAEREQDARKVAALDEAFHSSLVKAAGNTEMARIHGDITEKIRIIRRLDFLNARRVDVTYEEHAKVLRLIARRNVTEAQILLRAHITESRMEVRKFTLHMLHEARAQAGRGGGGLSLGAEPQ